MWPSWTIAIGLAGQSFPRAMTNAPPFLNYEVDHPGRKVRRRLNTRPLGADRERNSPAVIAYARLEKIVEKTLKKEDFCTTPRGIVSPNCRTRFPVATNVAFSQHLENLRFGLELHCRNAVCLGARSGPAWIVELPQIRFHAQLFTYPRSLTRSGKMGRGTFTGRERPPCKRSKHPPLSCS